MLAMVSLGQKESRIIRGFPMSIPPVLYVLKEEHDVNRTFTRLTLRRARLRRARRASMPNFACIANARA